MGACHNISRAKATIRANLKQNNKNELYSDLTSKMSQTSLYIKNQTTRSNISVNSTSAQIPSSNNTYVCSIPATFGEIEIPILVERKEKIMIKFNKNKNDNNNLWSFLKNEQPINNFGYPNYKYKNKNVGSLLMRITGDSKIYYLNEEENTIIANDRGYLLFSANLDNDDYLIYEPKGSLSITICGGNYSVDNELYFSNNINCFSNKNKINLEDNKEYQILDYINKARNNLKKFYHFYLNNIDEINLELKQYIFNSEKRKLLNISKQLNDLAKKFCEDLCENETAGNIGTDGLDLKEKLKSSNIKCNNYSDSIIYNTNNPLLIVKNLIIDKYSKKKKNRHKSFFDKYKNVGIYLKEHPIYKFCCVIIFSD